MFGTKLACDDRVMTESPPHTDQDVPELDERALAVAAREQTPRDYVDDVGEASFPASDPPSWWSGH